MDERGTPRFRTSARARLRMIFAVPGAVCALAGPAAANEDCRAEAEVLVCKLQVGQTSEYTIDQTPAKSLKLVNHSDTRVQIFQIRVKPLVTDKWGEYCLSIRDWRTGQLEPGVGEVACTHKEAIESEFGPLEWNTQAIAPTVAPGSSLFVGGYVQSASGHDHRKTVYVTARAGTESVRSFRQPRLDQPIRCSGSNQTTEFSPWKNTTGRDLTLSGAIIYAVDPGKKRKAVDEACISILDASGAKARWRYCAGVNVRGNVSFLPVAVAPEEHISAQATHNCAAPALWDWAAYIHVR